MRLVFSDDDDDAAAAEDVCLPAAKRVKLSLSEFDGDGDDDEFHVESNISGSNKRACARLCVCGSPCTLIHSLSLPRVTFL